VINYNPPKSCITAAGPCTIGLLARSNNPWVDDALRRALEQPAEKYANPMIRMVKTSHT
jgi:hypothetical protein